IRAFWEREQANVSGDEATRRLDQVVAHVVDEHGELVAVATVAQKVLPRLGQPMYCYRCFDTRRRCWRNTRGRTTSRASASCWSWRTKASPTPCAGRTGRAWIFP